MENQLKSGADMPDRLNEAISLFQQGLISDAEKLCGDILEQHPNHPGTINLYAIILATTGRAAETIGLINRAVENNVSDAVMLCNLGRCHLECDEADNAIKAYNQALRLEKHNHHALFGLGKANFHIRNYSEAVRWLLLAIKSKHNHVPALNNLGLSYLMLGNADKAKESFEKALQHNPSNPETHNNLANLYFGAGNADKAIHHYKKALAHCENYTDATLNYGKALVARQQYGEAQKTFESLLKKDIEPGKKREAENNLIGIKIAGYGTLAGKRLALERVAEKHAAYILACERDDRFMALMNTNRNARSSAEMVEADIKNKRGAYSGGSMDWVIVHDGTAIGTAHLVDIQSYNRRAEFQVGIREKKHQGAGVALEASLLVLSYAFNELHLHKLISYVYDYNKHSQDSTIALGFRQEGLLEEYVWNRAQERYVTMCCNGMTEAAFRANPRLAKLSIKLLGHDVCRAHM